MRFFYLAKRSLNQLSNDTHNSILSQPLRKELFLQLPLLEKLCKMFSPFNIKSTISPILKNLTQVQSIFQLDLGFMKRLYINIWSMLLLLIFQTGKLEYNRMYENECKMSIICLKYVNVSFGLFYMYNFKIIFVIYNLIYFVYFMYNC